MSAWGEFYAVVPADELEAARAAAGSQPFVSGSYPDAVWCFFPDRLDEYDSLLRRGSGLVLPADKHNVGRYTLVPLLIPPFSFAAARIEYQREKFLAHIPGVKNPLEVMPDRVFRSGDWQQDMNRRIGDPPTVPPVEDSSDESVKAMQEHGQRMVEWSGRREVAQWDAFCAVLDGKAEIPTGAGRRIQLQLKERQRREVEQVRNIPTLMAEMLKGIHPEQRRRNDRKALVRGKVTVIDGDHGQRIRATIAEPSRNALMGRAAKSPRWKGQVEATPALPWQWNGEVVVGENATAHDLGEMMIALCAELDVDFHRTMVAVCGEITARQYCVASALNIHRLRGGVQKMNAEERKRYERHLELLTTLYFRMELPGSVTVEIPAVARGARTTDRKQEVLYAVPPQAVAGGMPTSVVGLMLDDSFGHRAGFLLDKRLAGLDEFAYSLGIYLSRQWAARGTIRAVEGNERRQHHSLESVLDGTTMRGHWRSRMAKQGRPWLRDAVERALADIRAVGLHGAAGTATVEWNDQAIGQSKVVFGEPPPHILEAHHDRNSLRIDGAKKKRSRLDTTGNDRPARQRTKKPTS